MQRRLPTVNDLRRSSIWRTEKRRSSEKIRVSSVMVGSEVLVTTDKNKIVIKVNRVDESIGQHLH